MRFVLYEGALNSEDSHLRLLDRIVDRIADEIHILDVIDADVLQESRWYTSARQTHQKLLMSAVASPVRETNSPRQLHTRTVHIGAAEDIARAEKLAHTPLTVLVENGESDGALLDIFVEKCAEEGFRSLWLNAMASTPRPVVVESAGGVGEFCGRISKLATDASREKRELRLIAVCDSDARWPGDSTNTSRRDVERVGECCKQHGITHIVLKKRSAENYIPDDVVRAYQANPKIINDRDRFGFFLSLTALQRDHFPVKTGLKADERDAAVNAGLYGEADVERLKPLEEKLFRVSGKLLVALVEGFNTSFTEQGLRARDGKDEIDQILTAIASEL